MDAYNRTYKPASLFHFIIIFLLIISVVSCRTVAIKREIRTTQEIASIGTGYKYIKAHMNDGTVYVLNNWSFSQTENSLSGHGKHLDINRRLTEERYSGERGQIYSPKFLVNMEDIVLIETNDPGPSIGAGLAVITGVTAAIAVYCLINPKACFGSCPTFYAFNGDSLALMAEGFSSSVLPSRENNDIDMLYHAVPGKKVELKLTNEALETHVIRYANLLIAEKKEGERVFATHEGDFLLTENIIPPSACYATGKSCLDDVLLADGKEYFSTTDPNDINTREDIYIRFSNPAGITGGGSNINRGRSNAGSPGCEDSSAEDIGTGIVGVSSNESGRIGLVIGKRQTLLTTYLFYQGLSYMGHSATYWMAETERGNLYPESLYNLLGGIEVYRKTSSNEWIYEGELDEHGPIATDYNIIPLSAIDGDDIELKLVMTRGLWRINYLALATVKEEVNPVVVRPNSVEKVKGHEENSLQKLLAQEDFLVTYPGDIYNISYELPFENAELFLDSKGYYLEWIRDEWVEEQSLRNFRMMAKNPQRYFRVAARKFKELEPLMEETFWNSRYVEK